MENNSSIYKYGNNIIWSLPCLFQYEMLFGAMQSLLDSLCFNRLNVNVYGSPMSAWSGGRSPIVKGKLEKDLIERVFNYVINIHHGIPTINFSRIDITKDELNNEYENWLLDFFIEHGARFIVSSDILKNYIKEKNPSSTVVASILKPIYRFQGFNIEQEPTIENETIYYNRLLKEYDIVVLRSEYAKNVLAKNPVLIDNISKVEVLINALCINNCPYAPSHYTFHAKCHKTQENINKRYDCYRDKYSYLEQYKSVPALSTVEINTLIKSGVKHLKLQGRGDNIPYIVHLYNLSSQIFNNDGANAIINHRFLYEKFKLELIRFNSLVDINKKWQFQNAFEEIE